MNEGVSLPANLVHVTPFPIFIEFDRFHDRMVRLQVMLEGMVILGFTAATHVSTVQAHPQMHPAVPGFQALFAALGIWGNIFDGIEV